MKKLDVYRQSIVKAYEVKDCSTAEFCNIHGITKNQLFYWRKKLNAELSKKALFIPLEMKVSNKEPVLQEVILTNGIKIKFNHLVPVSYLKDILNLL